MVLAQVTLTFSPLVASAVDKGHHNASNTSDVAHATSLVDEDEDDINDLPNVDVHAIVYAYCERNGVVLPRSSEAYPYYDPSQHGRPVYVGQTIQALAQRDAQHINAKCTSFDRQYEHRSQYILVRLDERTFPRAASNGDFVEHTLRPAAGWMDLRESRRIDEFDTYNQGYNNTKGGQWRGWLVAMREARAKMMIKRFATVYMPALRAYFEKNENINVPYSYPVLGKLLDNIRQGQTIPPQFEDELRSMGLDLRNQYIVKRDALWEDEYMPAFRVYFKDKKHVIVPTSYPMLGKLLDNIRQGNTTIPPQFEDELLSMGLDLRNQHIVKRDALWEDEYMPAFRVYFKDKKHVIVPQRYPVIGNIVNHIRNHYTVIPPQFEDELRQKGFFWCTQNLARHVTRMLGRSVTSLEGDPEAARAVADAARIHAAMLTKRTMLKGKKVLEDAGLFRVPFGTRPLSDGVDRFLADQLCLSEDKKRKRSGA